MPNKKPQKGSAAGRSAKVSLLPVLGSQAGTVTRDGGGEMITSRCLLCQMVFLMFLLIDSSPSQSWHRCLRDSCKTTCRPTVSTGIMRPTVEPTSVFHSTRRQVISSTSRSVAQTTARRDGYARLASSGNLGSARQPACMTSLVVGCWNLWKRLFGTIIHNLAQAALELLCGDRVGFNPNQMLSI